MIARSIAVVLFLTALVSSVEGHKFWTRLHCEPAADATVNFQVYLHWQNEAALDQYVATGDVAHLPFDPRRFDIAGAVAQWRGFLVPSTASHVEVAQWLRKAGVLASCRADWDSYHCEGVAVAKAQQLFKQPFCAFRENFEEMELHVRAAAKNPGTFLMIDGTAADLRGLPGSVRYVGGVTVFDPTTRPHRREISASTLPAESTPDHFWPVGSAKPVIINGLGMPAFGSVNEMALALVAVSCSDGTPALSSTTTLPLNQWCKPNVPFPIQIQIGMSGFGSVLTTLSESNCAPASSTNFSSPYFPLIVESTSALANHVVCQLDISSFIYSSVIPSWTQLGLTAATVFSDLSMSNTSVMSGFWAGEFGLEMKATWPNPMGPSDIRKLFDVPETEEIEDNSSAAGILEFTDTEFPRSGFQVRDLRKYLVDYGIVSDADADSYLAEYLTILGGKAGESRGETSLDIEMMMSLAKSGHTYLWNILNGPNQTYVHWAQAFIAWGQSVTSGSAAANPTLSRPSSVWSISYGGPEWSNTTEANMLNGYFKLLSASGVTVVVSSGDSGAGFQVSAPLVSFPASSPYVVAAGATALKTIDTLIPPVLSVCSTADGNVITSGGGFSQNFQVPDFQASAVADFLKSVNATNSSGPQYPSGMRAIPDVTAIGAWVNIVMSNMTIPVFGTSISAPVFSSLLALINDKLRRNGKPSLSLTNNLLYNLSSQVFSDVTIGNNCAGEQYRYSANFPSYSSNACYYAQAGWDPASGLGSPSYTALSLAIFGNTSSTGNDKSNKDVIIGAVVGGIAAAGIAVLAFFKFRRPSAETGEMENLVQ